MKKNLLRFGIFIAAIALSINANAQNLISGGDMEAQGSWDTVWVSPQTHDTYFTFGYDTRVPSKGSGKCLNIYSESKGGDALFNNDIILFHPMTVKPGKTYKISGAFADFTADTGVFNFWCEIGYSIYNPKDSVKTGTNFLLAMNTWDGCGPLYDGTFQEASCKYQVITKDNDTIVYPYFHVPDTLKGDQTYYFILEIGTWNNKLIPHTYDVCVDELMVVDSATSSSNILITEISNSVKISNHPNPVQQSTTINYTIPQSGNVELNVYNVLGQQVKTLVNEFKTEGIHEVIFNTSNLPGSLYFYTLKYNGESYTNKMMIVR